MTAAGLGRAGDPSGGAGDALSIGSVLDALRADFPEITISKIRFLESEGLISPSRTPAGYRQFDHADVERLRFVLSAQRDHYLPLKVIRAKLEEFDRDPHAGDPTLDDPVVSATTTAPPPAAPAPGGPVPSAPVGPSRRGGVTERRGLSAVLGGGGGGGGGGGYGGDGPGGSGSSDPDGPAGDTVPGGALITREALLGEDGVDEQLLAGLEHHGILRADLSGRFEPEAPVVVRTAAALARLGVEPRLLRGARASADREVGLLTQLLTPVARSRAPEAGRRAEELSTELASLSGRLHALLVGAGLRSELRR